jgi:uncharacterized PurR-regulated membrane protein YhhQ (DUF165 family)
MNSLGFKFIILLSSLIITANLCAAITENKMINFYLFTEDYQILWGVIPFCIANFLLDVFTNQYGLENSKRLILGIILSEIFLALVLGISVKTKPISNTIAELYYQNQLNTVSRGLYSGAIATFIAFYINCNIFSKMLFYFNGKYLWLRCIVATSVGELIFSSISNIIFYLHKINAHEMIAITLNNFSFKFTFEIITLPITYLLAYLLSKYETAPPIKFVNFKIEA